MNKAQKARIELEAKVHALAPEMSALEIASLRRAAITLHGWYEHECNGVIQRDEDTGVAYWYSPVTGQRGGKAWDRERGAEKKIAAICARHGLHFFLQTDPRGGTLYIDKEPIPDNNYNRATFIA